MTTAAGISTTTVSTDQLAPLGFELVVPASSGKDTNAGNGPQTWVYVFNDDPSNAFAAGTIVYRDPSTATQDWFGATITPATTHQPQVMCLGVAQHAIAVGSYGFVLKRGVGLVLAGSAGVGEDSPFTSGGSAVGTALTWADDAAGAWGSNISVIGHAATAIGAGVTGTAYVNCG